ncbi:MAG: shikimate kinase [Pedobacter sp.]|nr:shikimate kinase [Chitinophagaceae bacterium]
MSKIFLIGMMGSGKSYWAQQIAASTHFDWMDLDAEIEKENAMTIKEIFETEGEKSFRLKEKMALHQLAKHKNIIIATGGGAPCFYDNITWMNANGITIFINESIEILVQRLRGEKSQRPLISSSSDKDLHNFLENKLADRLPFYSQATYTITGSKATVADFVKLIKV